MVILLQDKGYKIKDFLKVIITTNIKIMSNRYIYLLSFILCLLSVIGKSQVKFQEKKYSWDYSGSNHSYDFSVSIKQPYVIDDYIGINKKINKFIKDEISDSYFVDTSLINEEYCIDCDSLYFAKAETRDINYHVYSNNAHVLSLGVSSQWTAGGGGNGFSSEVLVLNYDMQKGVELNLDSILLPKSKEKINTYLKSKPNVFTNTIGDEAFDIFGTRGSDHTSFYNFLIKEKKLVLLYMQDWGRGNSIAEVEIPFSDLKNFIKKSYSYLYN